MVLAMANKTLAQISLFSLRCLVIASLVGMAIISVAISDSAAQTPPANPNALTNNAPSQPTELLELPNTSPNSNHSPSGNSAPTNNPPPANNSPVAPKPPLAPNNNAVISPAPTLAVVPQLPSPAVPSPSIVPTNTIPVAPAVPSNGTNNTAAPSTIPPQVIPPIVKSEKSPVTENITDTSHDLTMTLMFTNEEMEIVAKIIKAYDSYDPKQAVVQKTDNFAGLFDSLKTNEKVIAPVKHVKQLPNIYLGSIVFYSNKNWAVDINGRIIADTNNFANGEFYVTRISRMAVEIVWKPSSMEDVSMRWKSITDNGKKPLNNITVDLKNGTITLLMRPNQTFVTAYLAIGEGLIKPVIVPEEPPTFMDSVSDKIKGL